MVSLQFYDLMMKVASASERRKELFSREEISKKINEIKYLSAQKKIPRLTLRKEIIHLEHKLRGLDQIEQEFKRKEKRESVKVIALKKQISALKQKLAATEDKDIGRKVQKLSFLLGECLAKKEVQMDVNLSKKITAEAKGLKVKINYNDEDKINELRFKIEQLKNNVALSQQKNPEKVKILLWQIKMLEGKLAKLGGDASLEEESIVIPEVKTEELGEIRHELLFRVPPADKTIVMEGNNLPPPQKRVISKKN